MFLNNAHYFGGLIRLNRLNLAKVKIITSAPFVCYGRPQIHYRFQLVDQIMYITNKMLARSLFQMRSNQPKMCNAKGFASASNL